MKDTQKKICSLEELAAKSKTAKENGETVVMAHGVFDLVHLGHIRHLLEARNQGNLLIVTLTTDKYVNKGPNRPIFPERMRAETLAALEYVDWVGISEMPTSEQAINKIQPDVYVKGSEYESPENDVTGQITEERRAIERVGGQIIFTKDITFSSSTLINRHFEVYDEPLRNFLKSFRDTGKATEVLKFVDKASKLRVLLIGDAIIDEYKYVQPMGKSAKENIIATKIVHDELFAGGVFAAANHVASFCQEVEIITSLGLTNSFENLIHRSLKPNVRLNPIPVKGVPTTRKTRYVDETYLRKLFEVYEFDDSPIGPVEEQALQALIIEKSKNFDLVLVADFGHGLISANTIQVLTTEAPFLVVNTQTNSANLGYNLITRYPKADMICVDAPESQLATGDRISSIETIIVEKLSHLIKTDRIIVTHGKNGCVTWSSGETPLRIPAFTKTVLDTVGAGDSFLSVASVMAAAGAPIDVAGFIGNAAGAMKVGIVGHRQAIEKVPLIKYLTTLLK